MKVSIEIRYLPHHEGLPPIARMTGGASGYDLHAACVEDVIIEPGKAVLVPAGFEMAVPDGQTYLMNNSWAYEIDRDVLNIPEVLLERFDESPPELLKPIFDSVWNACGYARSSNYDEDGKFK